MASLRRPIAGFLYRSLYWLIYGVALALLLITPADAIDQALRGDRDRQYYIIWVVAVCCVLTVAILTFVYALRLYSNQTVLASIPKGWVPIEKGDVDEKVHKVIEDGLERSAQIAWGARPRANTKTGTVSFSDGPTVLGQRIASGGLNGNPVNRRESGGVSEVPGGIAISIPEPKPVWGEIEHYGWTSPNSTTLPPLLSYDTVISELPALTEAKVLTLAPPNPAVYFPFNRTLSDQPPLDPAAIAVLQRPHHHTMRDYIGHLAGLGVLAAGATTNSFLTLYEYARFSTRPISNDRFRELMHLFAEILRSMKDPDPLRLKAAFEEQFGISSDDGSFDDGDIDDDAPASQSPSTPRSVNRSGHDELAFPTGLDSSKPSVGRGSSAHTWNTWQQFRTAPTTPKDPTPRDRVSPSTPAPRIRTARTAPLPMTSSSPVSSSPNQFFAHSRKPYAASQYSGNSGRTLSRSGSIARSFVTHRSGSSGRAGSVIRLAFEGEDAGGLPFVITSNGL